MKRTKLPKCKCGCGQEVKTLGRKFIAGHNFRLPLDEQTENKRREKISKTMKKILTFPKIREKMFQKAWKGRPHSEKTKKKLSILRTGEGNGMFGKTISKETIAKILESRKGYKHSEETKRKIGEANKKHKHSDLQKQQISKTLKQYYLQHSNPFKGKQHTKSSKLKMRKANLYRFRGENGPNWQGGISSLPYGIEWTPWLRQEIKTRDKNKCQNPKCINPLNPLEVHHIDYDKQNNYPSNLITLCKRCHGKTHIIKNRRKWRWYYTQLMEKKQNKKVYFLN